ncbi:MAG: type I-E CRISPR-associated protein Cse2/CasB [Acidimicrobiales bacterium]|jgi:CRISPR system Cascade subunit CasB
MSTTEIPAEAAAPASPLERMLAMAATRPEVLAQLRRGVGRPLEDAPAAWPYVIPVGGGSRWRENAAHVTLALFALHQQSQDPGSMNRPGNGVGKACRLLATARGDSGASEEAVERRFRAALGADTLDALAVHLRGLVTLLRGAGISLDYPRLYRDLCAWLRPESRQRVALRWARDFFNTPYNADNQPAII